MAAPPQAFATALQFFQSGNRADAEATCRQIVERAPGYGPALHLLGVLAHQAGRTDAAIDLIRQALLACPDNPEFYFNLGVAQQVLGRCEDAVASYEHVLRLRPEHAEAHNNLGNAFLLQGRLDRVLDCVDQALRQRPHYGEALVNRGEIFRRQGKRAEAEAALREALRLQPDDPEAHNCLALVFADLGRPEEAQASFEKALRLQPDHAAAANNLGKVLETQGRLAEAEVRYREAVRLRPGQVMYLNNLANVLTGQGRAEEAVPLYRQAVRLEPGEAAYHSNLGNALTLAGRPDEAEACCRHAVRLQPDFADGYHNLAITLGAQGKLPQALAINEQALRLRPDHVGAHNCQAMWWLQTGNFEQGWEEYEWRWKKAQAVPRPFPQPLWDGSPLVGRTILLHAEQGLGDTLQFIRYAARVKQCGGTVIVECQTVLVPLLSRCPFIDRVVAQGDRLPDFDVHSPLLGLPRILGTTLATIPAEVPYLFPDTALIERWDSKLRHIPGFKIGIAWQGNPRFPGDCMRSIPLAQFAALARVNGVRLFSLQKGTGSEQLRAAAKYLPVFDLASLLDETTGGFMDTAAVMKKLDLVITSDTAMAHLAGALAAPVWVALGVGADWRYLLDREDSPWYPTMRVFRQNHLWAWDGVFDRMAAELGQRVGSSGRSPAVPGGENKGPAKGGSI